MGKQPPPVGGTRNPKPGDVAEDPGLLLRKSRLGETSACRALGQECCDDLGLAGPEQLRVLAGGHEVPDEVVQDLRWHSTKAFFSPAERNLRFIKVE